MSFFEMIVIFQTLLYVSIRLIGTTAEEPKCPMHYIEERMLERMMTLELKSDMTLQRLDEMKTSEDEIKKSTVRQTLQPFHDALRVKDLEYGGWQLVFRATSGNGHNVYQAWTNGLSTCDSKPETMERSNACHYRSYAVSAWSTLNIEMVKFALYKRDKEVAYIIFNGQGSDSNNWFSKSRVISSSWPDLTNSQEFNYFSIAGHVRVHDRRFFINLSYNGCNNDLGLVAVLDTESGVVCDWDRQPNYPQFLYSQINFVDYWNAKQFGKADYMAIFIKTT